MDRTDAHRDHNAAATGWFEWLSHSLDQLSRQCIGLSAVAMRGDDEFVCAEPESDIFAAQGTAQTGTDGGNHLIADRPAVTAIDRTETIKVGE
ncbi:hypothetical protein BGM19_01305 [Streptomyces agglomeratus]|nr:hypothetical protein BGM19_01305 [Streptomyces agglomeratus]